MSKEQWHLILSIITLLISLLLIISIWLLFGPKVDAWISMSGIAIGTFIFLLICITLLMISKRQLWYLGLSIITLLIIVISAISFKGLGLVPKVEAWISMSGIAIGTFIFSLICMDYLTYKSKKEAKETLINKIVEIEKEIQNLCCSQFKAEKNELLRKIRLLKESAELNSIMLLSGVKLALFKELDKKIEGINKELEGLEEEKKKEKTDEKIELMNKKMELLSEEPVGVLDKHEIRRSLTISLTIVYFMLLFFSIFSPVTTTIQVINLTDITPETIIGNIKVGNVSLEVTGANITLTNTTHTTPTPNLQSPFVEIFSYVYWAVIAFYFGSRVIESYIAKKK